MTSRSFDWSPLGHWWDPIPGAPDALDRCAADYRGTASSLGVAASSLDKLQNSGEMSSEAVTAIMARAKETAGTLRSLQFRYEQIAKALAGYTPALRHAQAESLGALEDATEARARENRARSQAQEFQPGMLSSDCVVRDHAVTEHNRCVAQVRGAHDAISAAKERLQKAIDARNDAGDKATGVIRAVVDDSSLNDTLLDKVGAAAAFLAEKIGSVLQWVWDHLEEICLVLDGIALVLLLASAVFPPLAGVAATIFAATWIAGMVKGAVETAEATTDTVKGLVTGLTTGNWEPLTVATLSLGLSAGFLLWSVVSGPAAAPFNIVKKGVRGVATSYAQEIVQYGVTESWEYVEQDSKRRDAPERRVVPCW